MGHDMFKRSKPKRQFKIDLVQHADRLAIEYGVFEYISGEWMLRLVFAEEKLAKASIHILKNYPIYLSEDDYE